MQIKSFLLGFCVWASIETVLGIPAQRSLFSVRQPDGSSLTLTLCGDEFFHYYATTDGLPVKQDADGYYCYAQWQADSLIAGHRIAQQHVVDAPSVRSELFMQSDHIFRSLAQRTARARALQFSRHAVHERSSSAAMQNLRGGSPTNKSHKSLAILVNFSDREFVGSDAQDYFNAICNQTAGSPYGLHGSVRKYFLDQSFGKLDLQFDVLGPVTVSRPLQYYGADGGEQAGDVNVGELVAEACKLVDDKVNFADYDSDGDGEVDEVIIFYAGYSQANHAPSYTIWPQLFYLEATRYGKVLRVDNVKVNRYLCVSELEGNSGSQRTGINVFCHEFSHSLGLPDFYDTYTGNVGGMSMWSLMDGGHLLSRLCPVAYTAYERMLLGWLQPQELVTTSMVEGVSTLSNGGKAYAFYNPNYRDEFYMLENRQCEGWDQYLPGHGMLLYHVDYMEGLWEFNVVNTSSSHLRMAVVPANGRSPQTDGDGAGHPFPGAAHQTQFSRYTTPAAMVFNPLADGSRFLPQSIENIRETDGKISFRFVSPQSTEIEDIKAAFNENQWVTVYTPDGRVCRRAPYATWHVGMPRGVYMLQGIGVSRKVFLP